MSESKIKLTIDNREVEVPAGTSILKAARAAGISIPALCWNDDLDEHITSCMICLVKIGTGKLVPSCSVPAASGEHVITDDPEIREARQMGLNLLLSEHVGDCEAPCQIGCPAHMNIPRMNRLIAEGKFEESLRVVKRDIAIPAILGRICPAPCEGACHRRTVDEPVSICLLKRFVGDENDLHPFPPQPQSGHKVAVIGSGPAGLSAAYYLQLKGVSVTLIDREEKPGGLLRTAIGEDKLPHSVLDKEIQSILNTGVVFKGNTVIDDKAFSGLIKKYDAVIVATGNIDDLTKSFQLKGTPSGLEVNRNNYETSEKGVFAIGNVIKSSRLAVRSSGQGKEAAFSVLQYLNGQKVKGEHRIFNSRFGKLNTIEFSEYLKEAVKDKRLHPDKLTDGFSKEEAIAEALRCMHCDCRAIDNCKLRAYSDMYNVDQKKYQTSARRFITKIFHPGNVVYEPQKCIKCGICVKITEKYREQFGLTFIGRGFDVVVGIPFDESLGSALEKTAREVADACPTGAIERQEPDFPSPARTGIFPNPDLT